MRVLVVDDEELIRELLMDELLLMNHEVDQARNGREAWEMCQRKSFDLVISDIRMPKGDGVELLKSIKKSDQRATKVLLITGYSDLIAEQAFELGAEGFILKPFDLDQARSIIARVEWAMEKRWSGWRSDAEAISVQRIFESKTISRKQNDWQLGMGGFFVSGSYPNLRPGDLVQFDFEWVFDKLRLQGLGEIVWTRKEEGASERFGIGVEILSMDEKSIQAYSQWVKSEVPISYVPGGKKF